MLGKGNQQLRFKKILRYSTQFFNVRTKKKSSMLSCSRERLLKETWKLISELLLITAPLEKSFQIILVRDLDGKTFWDALDDAISPRIKAPTSIDESALSTFRSIFQGRPLKKGTFIFLTWLDPSKMLVSLNLTYSILAMSIYSTRIFAHLRTIFCSSYISSQHPLLTPHQSIGFILILEVWCGFCYINWFACMYCDAQVCVSPNGLPVSVDAEIESKNVTLALFDVFFGNAPVSPSLKDSVGNGLSTLLK